MQPAMYTKGPSEASGSKSNNHCSGFGQIPEERGLATFPAGTYTAVITLA